jgi:uridine kinase
MTERAFVLGLSGTPGAGKTTLTRHLHKIFPQSRIVYYDQFQTITQMGHEQVRAWFARGGDPNEFALSELAAELTRQTQRPSEDGKRALVIYETPFGRMHRTTGAFIDFLVWIDTPLDLALARATLAFLQLAQREKSGRAALAFVQWQEQYMINYPMIRPMYIAQRDTILGAADLVVDGTREPTDSSAAIVAGLAGRGVTPGGPSGLDERHT